MKRLLHLLTIFSVFLLFAPESGVQGQSASDVTWTSSITYFTTSETGGTISVVFHDGSNTYISNPISIGGKSSGDVNIGSTSLGDDFKGSAVLSSDVPLFSITTQFAKNNTERYSKAISTGFNINDAGSKFYLATVRANGITETTIGVQNVENEPIVATLEFYERWSMQLSFVYTVTLDPGEAYVSKLPDIPTYSGGYWDGSLIIKGEKVSDGSPGKVVASAVETQDRGRGVYSYEGTKEGSETIYLPSAMCEYFNQTSFYAIQNVGSATAKVVVDYYDMNAKKVGSMPTKYIQAGAKYSTNPCDNRILRGQKGSAVVRSLNGVPLIAMGKITTPDGMSTAFTGLSDGSTHLAAPYIRWSSSTGNYRTYIAVMNLGNDNAIDIKVNYYGAEGNLVSTHTIASVSNPLEPNTKANTNPSMAGALTNGSFGYDGNGGAIEIISDQPIVVIVRAQISPKNIGGINVFAEDYNALEVPEP
jgi:hypothetical protein